MTIHVDTAQQNDDTVSTERWVLAASVIASGMAFIDATALNVALPAIQTQLRATGTELLWILNSYALVVAALILLGGALGDRYGHKQVFMLGISLFAVTSLACGLAQNVAALIAARACQGLGAALMIPGSLSLISITFEPSRRGRAIGTWTACSVVMTALGPILGGLLAQAGFWRAVFIINLPLALLAIMIVIFKTSSRHALDSSFIGTRHSIPGGHPPESTSHRLDFVGALLSVIGLATLNYGLIEAAAEDRNNLLIATATLIAIVSLAAFVQVECHAANPLLPLSLFRDRTLVAACLQTLCFYSGLFGMTFFLSLNLIQVQHYDAALAGLAQLPLMLLVVIISPVAGRLVDRYGPRVPLTIGGVVASLGFLLLAWPDVTTGPRDFWTSFLPPLILLGLAMGFSAAPLSTTVMNAVQQQHLGIASGINSTLSRLSAVLGVALLGLVALTSFNRSLQSKAADLRLTAAETETLVNESSKWAATEPPPGLSTARKADVDVEIKRAFVASFRVVATLCSGVVALSTLLTVVLLPRQTAT